MYCEFAAAGRIAGGAAGADSGNSDDAAHDSGLEARLEALQEALATKVAELARVSSERTALQLRCDKQEKAAREQELCAPLTRLRTLISFHSISERSAFFLCLSAVAGASSSSSVDVPCSLCRLIASSRSWGQEPAGSSPVPKYGANDGGSGLADEGSATGWALGDGPSSYNRRRRMVGRAIRKQ